MNPVGLPFFAGRIVTLRGSPGLIEVLLIPSRVSVWTEAVVSFQSVTLPLTFLSGTSSSMLAWGFVKFNFLSRPSRTISLFRSYTPATAWWACSATPPITTVAVRNPHSTTSRAIRMLIGAPSQKLLPDRSNRASLQQECADRAHHCLSEALAH